MSNTLHIDGRIYASPHEAAERVGIPQKDLETLIRRGGVRSVAVGKKTYVELESVRASLRSKVEKKVDTEPPFSQSIPEQGTSAPIRAVTATERVPTLPARPVLKTPPILSRPPAPPHRSLTRSLRSEVSVFAAYLLVFGIGTLGVLYLGFRTPSELTYKVEGALAAAESASLPQTVASYLLSLLGLSPSESDTHNPLDWPEIEEKSPPLERPAAFATSSEITYTLPPEPTPPPARAPVATTPPTIIERVIERVSGGGITREVLDAELSNLSSSLSARISGLSVSGSAPVLYTNQVWNDGLANALRIDQLDDVVIRGAEISDLEVTGSATSTFSNGINLSAGCFAVNGTCLGGGGATPAGSTGQLQFNSAGALGASAQLYWDSSNSFLGIGTSSPYAKLTVWGAGTGTGTLFEMANSASTTIAKFLDNGTGYFLGNIGIGTTTPYAKLSLTDAVSTAQVAIAYDATRYTNLLTNSVGDLVINPQGDDAFLNDDNLWVCTGGSCPSGNPTGTGNLVVENKQGIGTTTPDSKLVIETQDATTDFLRIASTTNQNLLVFDERGFLGIGTSTPTQQLSIANKLFVGNGSPADAGTATSTFLGDVLITGKLDVSTIDPVYTIDGVKYATYGHSTIGIKEEMTAKVTPNIFDETRKMFVYAIDFRDAPIGSDAWLFWQVTDFGEEWENLVAVLSPTFDGRVFYREDVEGGRVLIYAEEPLPVSVRLVADRFDARQWANIRPDQGGFPGLTPPRK